MKAFCYYRGFFDKEQEQDTILRWQNNISGKAAPCRRNCGFDIKNTAMSQSAYRRHELLQSHIAKIGNNDKFNYQCLKYSYYAEYTVHHMFTMLLIYINSVGRQQTPTLNLVTYWGSLARSAWSASSTWSSFFSFSSPADSAPDESLSEVEDSSCSKSFT